MHELGDELLEIVAVRLHLLGVEAVQVDQLVVDAVREVVLPVQHEREAAGHARAEVDAGIAQHHHHATGHVLAAVVADAFHHGERAGVAHSEALATLAGREQLAAGRAIQAGVAHDGGVLTGEARALRRPDHQLAAGHTLADIVVGVTLQVQVQAAGVPDAEALPGRALHVHGDRSVAHALIAMALGDLAGQACADRAVGVGHVEVVLAPGLALDRLEHLRDHLLGQLALVERLVLRLLAEARLVGQVAAGQQAVQVQVLLLGGFARQDLQQIGAADQVGHAAHPQLRHPLAGLAGDELEVVHDHLGQPDEVVHAQHLVLRGDTRCTVVQVADAQVLAAQRDHRAGAEAEALGTQDRGLDHVQAGLQAAVGLQAHLVAQVVAAQGRVGLGQAQLPRGAGVLHRGQRAGAGAAVVAGDGDQVGVGLGHAGGNGADPGLGNQLHRDQRIRVDLLEVEDQLRQVLDGVDVVVWRRRDQGHARIRVAQLRDHLVDFVPRQLAALAGLGALGDLDLQDLGVDQVVRGHAEAAGGHLLDLGHALGAVAGDGLAALAGIGAPAEAVHRGGQGLVGLRRQCAQAHARGVEARQDVGLGLDVVKLDGLDVVAHLQEVAQHGHRAFVHQIRVFLVDAVVAGLHRAVQGLDHVRVVGVVLAPVDVL